MQVESSSQLRGFAFIPLRIILAVIAARSRNGSNVAVYGGQYKVVGSVHVSVTWRIHIEFLMGKEPSSFG